MDKNEDKKPWDDSFSDDRDEQGNLSRVKLRKQKGNFKLILAVLISIVALIAIFSLAFGMSKQSSIQQTTSSKKVTKKADKTKPKKDKKKTDSESVKKSKKDSSSTAESSDDTTQASQPSQTTTSQSSSDDNSSQNNASQSNQNTSTNTTASSNSSNNSSNDASKYITVNQSEGIYRVATNAGISVSQLQSLNGLNDNSVIKPGQTLRIK
ncbi:LysM peptidoglycan-binding domain-containing protein [Fructilactobacillus sp. Tb1]|uniref:LysM peptidoglycan-binding domain-containing protein n=1 Tax=Fructilactobacillus sp. Tb1 TaxID=3422304 RepID=UPI003D2B7E74